jgi:hypothetical protein
VSFCGFSVVSLWWFAGGRWFVGGVFWVAKDSPFFENKYFLFSEMGIVENLAFFWRR